MADDRSDPNAETVSLIAQTPVGLAEGVESFDPLATVSLIARTPVGRAERVESVDPLAVGTRLGKFVVGQVLGAGAMGTVYEARDVVLSRRVALKVLRPQNADRLLVEARAAAALSHANVVTVYEVGADDEHGPYIAMEYVGGNNLRAWLAERARGWREILKVFLQAAAGVVAAHEAGLVHRDIKPDNILVDGERAKVADFGIAHPEEAPLAGETAGTPRYMAPEQWVGRSDKRSDQYGLCATLLEALGGRPPIRGAPPSADGARAPAWVLRTVLRGLSDDPAARHPDVAALVAALRRDPAEKRKKITLLAAAVAGSAVLVAVSLHSGDPCAGGEAHLVGVWDPAIRPQVSSAIRAESPLGRSTWRVVEPRLDAWAGEWTRARREACLATRVEGAQSEAVLDLRTQCLDRALRATAAMTRVLSEPSPGLAEQAALMLAGLPDLARCRADAVQASQVAPPDPSIAARVAALNGELDRAWALSRAGRHQEALEAADKLVGSAREVGYLPLQARADLLVSFEQLESQRMPALAAAARAYREATAAGDLHLGAEALVQQARVRTTGEYDRDFAEAAALAAEAKLLSGRLGDERLAVRGEHLRGVLLFETGDYAGARDQFQRVAATCRRLDDVELLHDTLFRLGRSHNMLVEFDTALALFKEAIALAERTLGPEHPAVARYLEYTVLGLRTEERWTEAEATIQRVINIYGQAYGPASPQVALANVWRIELLYDQNRIREALATCDSAIAGWPGNPEVLAWARYYRAFLYRDIERYAEAAADMRERVRLLEKSFPADQFDVASARIALIRFAALAGEIDDPLPLLRAEEERFSAYPPGTRSMLERDLCFALVDLERAEALEPCTRWFESLRKSPNDFMYSTSELYLARARLLADDARGAVEPLERLVIHFASRPGYETRRVASRWALARALVASGGDTERARKLARAAHDEILREVGETPRARKIARWLAER